MGYRNYATAKGHIVSPLGDGDFTTITAALAAATSGQTIFLRPGTYAENITLKAGVNLSAFGSDSSNVDGGTAANVIIKGTTTASFVGTCTVSGICFQTNGAAAFTWTGSAAVGVRFFNCYFDALNSTAITGTNANAIMDFHYCFTQGGGTNLIFNVTSCSSINFRHCILFANNKNIVSTIAAGLCNIFNCEVEMSLATTGSGNYTIRNSNISSGTSVSLALVGTGTSSAYNSSFDATANSGTAAAITVGAGTTLNIGECQINSNAATNAITGAGTINAGPLTFGGSASGNTVTTQTNSPFGFETTYTPVLSFGGGSTGITYSVQSGIYAINGNWVTFSATLLLSNKGSSTGAAAVTLPIAANGTLGGVLTCQCTATFPASTSYYISFIAASGTTCTITGVGSATSTGAADTNFANNTTVRISGTYLKA